MSLRLIRTSKILSTRSRGGQGALRHQAELSRATASQRALAFQEWILRPTSGLSDEIRVLLRDESVGDDNKRPVPDKKVTAGITDLIQARLHRTLVGTMQSIVEHLPEEVLGMSPLRLYIRWKESADGLDAELCVPARIPIG